MLYALNMITQTRLRSPVSIMHWYRTTQVCAPLLAYMKGICLVKAVVMHITITEIKARNKKRPVRVNAKAR